jgi:hypothetical protein
MRAQDKIGERNTLRKSFLSSIECIPYRVSFNEYDFSLPGYPARYHSFCRRRVETIRTNHGVLDISTIDASNCHAQIACFRTQAIEGFTDEQSPAALTKHRSSFYLSLIGEPRWERGISSGDRLLPHPRSCLRFLPRSALDHGLSACLAEVRPQGFRGVAHLQIR